MRSVFGSGVDKEIPPGGDTRVSNQLPSGGKEGTLDILSYLILIGGGRPDRTGIIPCYQPTAPARETSPLLALPRTDGSGDVEGDHPFVGNGLLASPHGGGQ